MVSVCRFIQQKHALVKETNIAKQTLRAEVCAA